MPVEIRYFRSDSHTINTVTARILGLSLSGVGDSITQRSRAIFLPDSCACGVRVYIRHADGSRDELTTDISAVVSLGYPTSKSLHSANWTCPLTALSPTDAIEIEVYLSDGFSGWQLADIWISEQLGATQLNSASWTFYYWLQASYSYSPISGYVFGITFYFDGTDDSRIENFSYTVAPPVRRTFGDGLTWITF